MVTGNTPRATATLALLALLLCAPSATAHDTVRLELGVGAQFCWTRSFAALSEADGLFNGSIRLGGVVWEGLSIEAGYRTISMVGDTLDSMVDTDFQLRGAELGARWDQPLLPWLSVHGRVAGAFARGDLELEWGSGRFRDEQWAPGVLAAVGASARLPRRWFGGRDGDDGGSGFTMGAVFDIGYTWFADLEYSARADIDGLGVAPAPTAATELGVLSIHGLHVTLGVSLNY